jgi:RNA polymerase sigma-70 factor (ECF subfamily)
MLTSPELVWLLAAVAKGDTMAFERLYQATRAKLYAALLRILRRADLADEVMAETYLKVWSSAGQFDPAASSPLAWILAMGRTRAIDLVRREPEKFLEEGTKIGEGPPPPDPAGRLEMSESLRRLLTCMGRLDEERRRLVLLAYYSAASRDRLSAELNQPAATVKSWLRRALFDIRECLDA